jgi:hypothetical protein
MCYVRQQDDHATHVNWRLQMIRRCLASVGALAAVMAVVSLASVHAGGQVPTAAATTQSAAAKTWSPPRTPWGEPDLQGVYRYVGATPLQRPKDFGAREFLTDAEVAQRTKAEQERLAKNLAGADGRSPLTESTLESGALNSFWLESGTAKIVSNRTSLIVGPDGQIPYTSEMRARAAAQAEVHAGRYPTPFFHQSWLEFETEERCLTHGVPGAMLGGNGEGPNQILQSPGYVVILQESFIDRRTIPTDGRPHGNIRTWRGDSVGRWEGDTLVVETINFADKSHYRWASDKLWRSATDTLRLVERFTRVDADTIDYQFTIEDPVKFTRPWTAAVPITKLSVPLLESGCHEGNYATINTLSAVRNLEKAAAEAAKKGKKGSR